MTHSRATSPHPIGAGVLQTRPEGLYCAEGDFYIDPRRPVARAIITHAHADHVRTGCAAYLCSHSCAPLLRLRVGRTAPIDTLPFGSVRTIGAARVSLHPAGHILGSAQVRVELPGKPVWVVSGDYNANHRSTCCEPFEPVRCEVFVTESTFGLPIYQWPEPADVFAQILDWWRSNRERGLTSILPAYPLGKSQRLLAGIGATLAATGTPPPPILVHGNANTFLPHYRAAGVPLPATEPFTELMAATHRGRALVITASGADNSALAALGPAAVGFASGWMQTRKARRAGGYARGFVLSDHSDWHGLITAIRSTGAAHIVVTHGETTHLTRWLNENGWSASAL